MTENEALQAASLEHLRCGGDAVTEAAFASGWQAAMLWRNLNRSNSTPLGNAGEEGQVGVDEKVAWQAAVVYERAIEQYRGGIS